MIQERFFLILTVCSMSYKLSIVRKKRSVYYYYPLNYFVLDPLETCLNLLESKSDKHLKGFAAACLQNGHLKSFFALQTLALPYKVKILRMRSQKNFVYTSSLE